jgi:hypothetical protein
VANTFITPNWVTVDTATGFLDSTKLIGRFDRQWDDSFMNKPGGAKIGDTVQVRIEQRWLATEGQALQQQNIFNQTVPITVNHQFNVGMGWSSSQATLEVEEVQNRYTRPAGQRLAAKWDRVAGAEVYKSVYFAVGTPGVNVTSNLVWQTAAALLQEQAVPDEYMACISPAQQATTTSSNVAIFNPTEYIGQMFKSGKIAGASLGMREWYYDPLLPMHTTGSFVASTPIVTTAGQTGSTLTTSGWGVATSLKAGDIFTIDQVFTTNPLEQDLNMGRLAQFVLTADVTGTGALTLAFQPPIITSGALQNVTNAPAASAAISVLGSTGTVGATMAATPSRQNLVFHPSAFAFVMVDLDRDLAGAESGYTSDKETRVKMRWAKQWNVQTDQSASRIDTIGGVASILPYFAVRVFGGQ